MNKDWIDAGITILIIVTLLGFFIGLTNSYNKQLDAKDIIIKQLNELRIEAENKPCCQVIQERYIDRRLSEDGLGFIYDESPSMVSCSDKYDYQGGVIIK